MKKKNSLLFIVFILFFTLNSIKAQDKFGKVAISEVYFDSYVVEDQSYANHHAGEFIELYNSSTEAIDISGWKIEDNVGLFTIPNNTIIASGGFKVITFTATKSLFVQLFPEAAGHEQDIILQSDFMLNNNIEKIHLLDLDNNLISDASYIPKGWLESAYLENDLENLLELYNFTPVYGFEFLDNHENLSHSGAIPSFAKTGIRLSSPEPFYKHNIDPYLYIHLFENGEARPFELHLNVPLLNKEQSDIPVQLSNENYIHTITYKVAKKEHELSTAHFSEKNQSITYYDGLGKAKQQIAIGQSPNNKDIVQHIEYDEFGRMSKQFLPHEYSGGTAGTYRTDGGLSTKTYYKNKYPEDFTGITNTNLITAYSAKEYELSPLNRVLKQSSPGELFKLGSGHELKFGYETNILNEVKIYTVTLSADRTPTLKHGITIGDLIRNSYGVGELSKNIIKDQNWKISDGKNNTTEEFKDKLGKIVLKRYYSNNNSIDTYFVYDIYGNLTYVLPPKSEPHTAKPDVNELAELCYQYKYDSWNRLVEKKLPGKQKDYIIYDNNDRPTLTQDGSLRASNLWAFSKYDTYGRTIYSGLYSSSKSRVDLQLEADSYITTINNNNSEDRSSTTKTIGQVVLNYENTAFPITNITEVLAVNYYDDYTFTDTDKPAIPTTIINQPVTTRTNGLHTSSWVKTIGQNTWTKTYSFYDEKGRELRVYSKNHLDGYTVVDSEVNFSGIVTKTVSSHKKTTSDALVTITDEFEYDHAKRLKKQIQQIDNSLKETITSNEYDGIGILIKKKIGGKTSPLQTIDYAYNINGGVTDVNDVNTSLSSTADKDLFAYKLNYTNPIEGSATVPQHFNGNVTQSIWRSSITDDKQAYSYKYDDVNRITDAYYRKGSSLTNDAAKFGLSGVTYDKAGNIKTLQRTGDSGQIDNLSYTYETVGVETNKLVDVTDASNNTQGYKDTNASGNNYTYDVNGRLTADKNKGVSNIEYNYLDLPKKITFTNGNHIEIIYDASGNKLEKLFVTSAGNTKTLYVDGFQYQNNQLQFFAHPEGYTYKEGSTYKYAYLHKDQLGNNRLSYSDTDGNGTITTGEVFSKTNYYPFGLAHSGEYISGNGSNYKYKFQGKELQAENNLQQYDFGSRMYDPSTGRWHLLDPQAEAFYGMSPYMAMGNNPIMVIDPDGEFWHILIGAAIGGIINVVQNWDNIDSFGDGLKYFGVGAASGAAVAATGNLALGGAITGLGNGLIQGQSGGDLLASTVMGGLTAQIGGALGNKVVGPLVNKLGIGKLTQNISNVYLKNALNYGVTNSLTGGITGGTMSSLTGGNFGDGFKQGFAIGLGTGIAGGLYQGHKEFKANSKPIIAKKTSEMSLQELDEFIKNNPTKKIHMHHSDPKFIGGENKQNLTPVLDSDHTTMHKSMNDFLRAKTDKYGNHMRPQRGNSGKNIRNNFTRANLLQAMSQFYKQPEFFNTKAAIDFFKQHPKLK